MRRCKSPLDAVDDAHAYSSQDCIGVKGNSSNVHVSNVVCHESGAMTIGSVGSNSAQPDYVENIVFDNITAIHSSNAAWIKTYPGNGYVRNVTFRNIQFEDVNQPIYVTSCICLSFPLFISLLAAH